jgi:hypothetical protein
VTRRRADSQRLGDPLEREEQAQDGTELRGQGEIGRLIEFAPQEVPQSFNARGRPVGEVGEGAVLDLAVLAKGLAQEDGGRGVAVGGGRSVRAKF